MKFETFINEISPKNSSQISISWNKIRDTIKSKSSIINSSFLTWSYARSTKIDPIDDLDIFFNIKFSNTEIKNTDKWILILTKIWTYDSHQLKNYTVFDDKLKRYIISPIQLINHIWKIIKETYISTNEQNRNWECYTVYLSSYNLTIDCVPYAWVTEQDYNLIPKWWNNLYWKKTNPKKDQEIIQETDNLYNWKLKWIIKVMKYWNKNKNTSKKIKSYILECLIYYAFQKKCNKNMNYVELLKNTIEYIYNNIENYCNIIDLSWYDCMHYTVDKDRVKLKLQDLYNKLSFWETKIIDYLKSN